MANKDAPFGFRAIGGMGSSYETQGNSQYQIADNSTSPIYQGDLCMTGGYNSDQTDANSVAVAVGYISCSSVTENILNIGVFNGCFYNDPTTQKPTWKNYYPASVNITQGKIDAFVYDNPMQLFEVQAYSTLSQSDMGNMVELGTYAAGSTVNGHSKTVISNGAISNTAQFRLIRVSEDPNNSDISSANCNWVVKFNEHIYYARTVKTA